VNVLIQSLHHLSYLPFPPFSDCDVQEYPKPNIANDGINNSARLFKEKNSETAKPY
jgi:hypothetical protein